ncbi:MULTISPECIES: ribonuclease III [Corynebacterium]|nr:MULTISPECIES: ribonuclease III [Corynebacterium]MDN8623692.1 ribonuclease III [Corynebacterium kroppenstedtii]QRQ64464.1 ribonuclease III [Corynebacterium kroppenstedtii]
MSKQQKNSKHDRLTGEEAWVAAFGDVDHQPLLDGFGVSLPADVLRLALTHRSFANENGMLPNNERLEFLGDAVLGLSVAERLYRDYPDRTESEISKMRAGVVNMYALADVAREIGLGDHVLLGRGEQLTNGKDKNSILADTTEAMLGAIYLEHGFQTAKDVILRLFKSRIESAPTVGLHMDWKTELLEKIAGRGLGEPEYNTTISGPAHDPHFTSTVSLQGKVWGHGEGHTKKEAEHHAAREAHDAL